MSAGRGIFMPANAEEQNATIREAGISDIPQMRLGRRTGLLYWSAIDASPHGTSDLVLCAGFAGGEVATRLLARNCAENYYEHVVPPLTLEQLKLLERLAVGREAFTLEPGRRFQYTGAPNQQFRQSEMLEVEVVTFGHVAFRQAGFVPRSLVTPGRFVEIPTWRHQG